MKCNQSKKYQSPKWVADAVFYQIFPDRFARSKPKPLKVKLESWDSAPSIHGIKGGDLAGIQGKLDYLQELGVTAIYINPIFESTANHRYHTTDFFKIDPILGDNSDFDSSI